MQYVNAEALLPRRLAPWLESGKGVIWAHVVPINHPQSVMAW